MQDVSFGREIHSHQWPWLKCRSGRHVQYAPNASVGFASRNHIGQIKAREMSERRYIELNLAQALLQIVLNELAVLPESGVVDEDVHLNSGAGGLIEHVCGRSRFGQIGGENQGTPAVRLLKFRS